ncbi:MAG: hypothetical protein AAFQ09_12135, partial [Pseudomonadota bacterium]
MEIKRYSNNYNVEAGKTGAANTATDKAKAVASGIQSGVTPLPDLPEGLIKNVNVNPSPPEQDAKEVGVNLDTILNGPNISDAARLLGRLMVEIGALQRKEALTDRLNAREAARGELQAGAAKLDAAADATRKGAIVNAVFATVGAMVSIGMSTAALGSVGKVFSGKVGEGFNDSVAQAQNGIGNAFNSGLGNGIGGSVNSMLQAKSQDLTAQNASIQAEAEVTKGEGELDAS